MPGSEIRSDLPGETLLTPNVNSETSVIALAGSLVAHRKGIALLTGMGLLIGGAFGITRPHTFTSHASFTADAQSSLLSNTIANQLGLSAVLGNSGSPSAQLYLEILQSPVILDPVVDSSYEVRTDGRVTRTTLVQLYKGNADTPPKAHANAVQTLAHAMRTDLRASGVVAFDVTTTDRALSQQIASRILHRLDEFSTERRRQHASSEREFNEGQVSEARDELHAAEARLQAFLQENRSFQNSPALTFEQDRLQRDVQFRQALYTAVAQAYEQARLEEARNTPAVNVVEPASLAEREDPRWGGLKAGLMGLVVGFVVGIAIAVFRDFFRESTRVPADREQGAMFRGVGATAQRAAGTRG